jgi:hypothetical protein
MNNEVSYPVLLFTVSSLSLVFYIIFEFQKQKKIS